MAEGRILTINTGSSSLKAALYRAPPTGGPLLTVRAERLGAAGARLRASGADGTTVFERDTNLPDHAAAVAATFGWLREAGHDRELAAVGHRIVHGGPHFRAPCPLTAAVRDALRALLPLDPGHTPQALAAIAAVERSYPGLLQIACFDTAFHAAMPRVARSYALPRQYTDASIIRYGFHGLSYEYIVGALHDLDPAAALGRVVIAHLGNGASMAAVRDGVGVDTTMGLTPLGGLMMGTRTGDLDPGVLLYLLQSRRLAPTALSDLLTAQSGLLGVSQTSADMRDLLAHEAADPRAAEAIALFCYTAKKFLGALVATLGGLDTLVFTGGIGEGAAPIRARICAGLEFLGIALDPGRNDAGQPVISRAGHPVTVRVLATDEDLMIARHTTGFIAEDEEARDGST